MNIKQIVKNKKIYFISPHLDDAVLSCGGLLLKLPNKEDITVINVFTRAHGGPYTLSARKFLKDSGGYKDATTLFKERILEDKDVLLKLKVKIINLAFQDALYRRNKRLSLSGRLIPEFDHLYPTYRWHVVKFVSPTDTIIPELRNKLKRVVAKNALVFAPWGTGGHVDHQVTRKVCESLFDNIIFYSEFPYNVWINNHGTSNKNYREMSIVPNLFRKTKLIKCYKTQFLGLFPDGRVPEHKEYYFRRRL